MDSCSSQAEFDRRDTADGSNALTRVSIAICSFLEIHSSGAWTPLSPFIFTIMVPIAFVDGVSYTSPALRKLSVLQLLFNSGKVRSYGVAGTVPSLPTFIPKPPHLRLLATLLFSSKNASFGKSFNSHERWWRTRNEMHRVPPGTSASNGSFRLGKSGNML
jgi:hypothetical protein